MVVGFSRRFSCLISLAVVMVGLSMVVSWLNVEDFPVEKAVDGRLDFPAVRGRDAAECVCRGVGLTTVFAVVGLCDDCFAVVGRDAAVVGRPVEGRV